ncbi:MAG: gamma-glutamylcyclotransferase family protein [Candidatus Caldarchaeum sp.]|nr:gamma-glutamylcyclotransferase family protein [Candidatus Caldarchaeum sp.]
MKVWYFAYGSNLDQEGMRRRVGGWYDLRPAVLRGFRLVFDVYSSSWKGGVADVVEDENGVVYGAAYLLDEQQLEKLDKYEGVPHLYHRRKVSVLVEGSAVDAFIYVGSSPRTALKPSPEYLSLMLKGLKKIGYGDDVIKTVREAAERRM